MSYKALYRKYRPSTFDEVSGQEAIVKILKNAISTGKIGHAYLFAGPRGTGKTTMAKLFAKALNCDEGLGHQCNKCKNCEAINNGSHPDVIEIDAASNNGVDEVRDLIDKVHYSTILGKYKVYIIDEVHMMTPGAFNALLKTLEEPPEHVIFVLATTEPHKILPTILSRCQRFDFSKLSDKEIKDRLIYVLNKEGITYEDEAIDIIVSLSDGGMRDALSILDQVLAYSVNNLKSDDVLNIFSIESKQEKLALLDDIYKKDVKEILNRVNNYIDKGSDIKRLTSDLIDIFKDILIYDSTGDISLLQILNEEEANIYSSKYTYNNALKNIDILLSAIKDYKLVTNINPIFEIALLKLSTNEDKEIKKEKLVQKVIDKPYIKEITNDKNKETIIDDSLKAGNDDNIQPQVAKEQPKEKEEVEKNISLFDAIDETKIDTNITYPSFVKIEEGQYYLSNDDLLNITAVAKRDFKVKYNKMWPNLEELTTHPKYGSKATLLLDGHLLLACKNIMIIEYDILSNVSKINSLQSQKDLQAISQIVFKQKIFIYAVSRKDSVDLQVKVKNLKEVNKLPKPDTIEIKMIGEN